MPKPNRNRLLLATLILAACCEFNCRENPKEVIGGAASLAQTAVLPAQSALLFLLRWCLEDNHHLIAYGVLIVFLGIILGRCLDIGANKHLT